MTFGFSPPSFLDLEFDMKLEQMKPADEDLIQTFGYPEGGLEAAKISITLKYFSPELRAELFSRIALRNKREGNPEILDAQRMLEQELAIEVIVRGVGATYGKIRSFVPISAKAVKEQGGLDAEVKLDPSVGGGMGDEARANIKYLVLQSDAFRTWVLGTSGNIAKFQSDDWEERAKNSESGQSLNSVQTPSTTVTA